MTTIVSVRSCEMSACECMTPPPRTVNLEHVFGPGLPVEVVCALGDDDHGAPLLPQPGLALCYGQMGGTGLLVQSQLPSVVVELPDPRRGSREGLWGGQVLRMHQHRRVFLGQNSRTQKYSEARIGLIVKGSTD